MAPGQSLIWKYFRVCDNENKAECVNCDKNNSSRFISRGKNKRSYSTKPLWNHFKNKHLRLFESAQQQQIECAESDKTSRSSSKPLSSSYPTLEKAFGKSGMWDLNNPKAKKVTNLICEMMAFDAEPFTLVEREGFKRFCRAAFPQYPLPNGTFFSKSALPEMYERMKLVLKEKLSTSAAITFTTDVWTSRTSDESFVSLTSHFLSPSEFTKQNFTLNARHFLSCHSEEHLSLILNQCLDEWEIKLDRVHIIVRNRAANVRVRTGLMTVDSVSCFIHKLQLVIHDAILDRPFIKDIITKCRKIASHLEHSPIACKKLEAIQEKLKHPPRKLLQDMSARWNSTYYILERLYEQKQAVTAYVGGQDIPTLTSYQWGLVENIIRVLRPFEEVTNQASDEEALISYVIPAVSTLHAYLSNPSKDLGVQTLKEYLKRALEKRFYSNNASDNIQMQKCFTFSTFLDPRFKTRFFNNEEEVKSSVMKELIQIHSKIVQTISPNLLNEIERKNTEPSHTMLHKEIHEDIWECLDELAKGTSENAESSSNNESEVEEPDPSKERQVQTEKRASVDESSLYEVDTFMISHTKLKGTDSKSRKNNIKAEMEKYLSLPLNDRNSDSLKWWRYNHKEFPKLGQLAIKYLSAPPSTVSPERLFIEASKIYTENRNRLNPDNAERLFFIMKNIKYLENGSDQNGSEIEKEKKRKRLNSDGRLKSEESESSIHDELPLHPLHIPDEKDSFSSRNILAGAVNNYNNYEFLPPQNCLSEFDSFGKSVANRLNSMQRNSALQLQLKIKEVVTNFRLQTSFDTPNNSSMKATPPSDRYFIDIKMETEDIKTESVDIKTEEFFE